MIFSLFELLFNKMKTSIFLQKTNLIFFLSSRFDFFFFFLFFFSKLKQQIQLFQKLQYFLFFCTLRGTIFRPLYKFFFWLFVLANCFLGWLGAQVVEPPYIQLSIFMTLFFFIYLILILPIIEIIEKLIFIQK